MVAPSHALLMVGGIPPFWRASVGVAAVGNASAFGNGTYIHVAGTTLGVGDYYVKTADRGATWPQAATANGADVAGAYGNGYHVFVGNNGLGQYTNNNGVSWTGFTITGGGVLHNGVVWFPDAGVWVVSRNASANFYTSPDLVTWTTRTGPLSDAWQGMCYSSSLQKVFCVSASASIGQQVISMDASFAFTLLTTPSPASVGKTIATDDNNIIAAISGSVNVFESSNAGTTFNFTSIFNSAVPFIAYTAPYWIAGSNSVSLFYATRAAPLTMIPQAILGGGVATRYVCGGDGQYYATVSGSPYVYQGHAS